MVAVWSHYVCKIVYKMTKQPTTLLLLRISPAEKGVVLSINSDRHIFPNLSAAFIYISSYVITQGEPDESCTHYCPIEKNGKR